MVVPRSRLGIALALKPHCHRSIRSVVCCQGEQHRRLCCKKKASLLVLCQSFFATCFFEVPLVISGQIDVFPS